MSDRVTYCDVCECAECPRYGDDCDGDKRNDDLISRSDAIEAVCGVVIDEFDVSPTRGYEVSEKALSALPSAEAVQGEWIDVDNYYRLATCSRCHKVTMFEKWGEYTKPYNYCPNCGARMKGAEHETD